MERRRRRLPDCRYRYRYMYRHRQAPGRGTPFGTGPGPGMIRCRCRYHGTVVPQQGHRLRSPSTYINHGAIYCGLRILRVDGLEHACAPSEAGGQHVPSVAAAGEPGETVSGVTMYHGTSYYVSGGLASEPPISLRQVVTPDLSLQPSKAARQALADDRRTPLHH